MRVDFNASGLLEKPIMVMTLKDAKVVISELKISIVTAVGMAKLFKQKGIHTIMPRIVVDGVVGLYSVTHFMEDADDFFMDNYIKIEFTVGKYWDVNVEISEEQIRMILRNILLAIHWKEDKIQSVKEHFLDTWITIL